jgi:hypothetical protein
MAIFFSAYKRAFSAVHVLHILQTLQRTGIWLVLAEIYIILAASQLSVLCSGAVDGSRKPRLRVTERRMTRMLANSRSFPALASIPVPHQLNLTCPSRSRLHRLSYRTDIRYDTNSRCGYVFDSSWVRL